MENKSSEEEKKDSLHSHNNENYFNSDAAVEVDKSFVINNDGIPIETTSSSITHNINRFSNETLNKDVNKIQIKRLSDTYILKDNDTLFINTDDEEAYVYTDSDVQTFMLFPDTVPESPAILLGDPTLSIVDEFMEDERKQKNRGIFKKLLHLFSCGCI